MNEIEVVKNELLARVATSDAPQEIMRATELKALYGKIATLPGPERGAFGKAVNAMKQELLAAIEARDAELSKVDLPPIDVTAPMDVNAPLPALLPSEQGSIHPLMREIETISDIFNRMGYVTEESREIDDQFYMFESLNFPKDHPARDDYDTFMTEETDANGDRLIAPAHTSNMQNRTRKK